MRRTRGYVLLRGLVALCFAILIGRLWYMQVVQVNAYRAQAVATKLQYRVVLAPRGIIYDRRGHPLVRNLPSLDVTATPDQWPVRTGAQESGLLSRLLHGAPVPWRIRRIVAGAQFHDPTRPVAIKTNVSLRTFYLVKSHANELPGVDASVNYTRRHYLVRAPWSMGHILGYVGAIGPQQYRLYSHGPWAYQRYTPLDLTGQAGIEAEYEHTLHGINGLQSSEIDAFGNQVSPWKWVRKPVPGDGVKLTISTRLQTEVTSTLRADMQKLAVPQAAAVVMNPNNGQILAMSSLPSFNPNAFTMPPGRRRARAITRIVRNPWHPLFDLTYQSAMPPGSIYKVITATAGLQDGVIGPNTYVDDTGTLERCAGCRVFHGWNPHGLGPVNVVSAIEQSSDIFFYQVAGGGPAIPGNGLGPWRLGREARRYGLGRPTGIQLPNEAAGLVPSVRELRRTKHAPWTYGDSYNMGIGQGDNLVTPLQMARVASVIANGGNLVRPQIVAGITSANRSRPLAGHNYALVPDFVRRHFVAPWIINLIRRGMALGVSSTSGTSYWNVDHKIPMAGKTGTAQTGTSVDAWWIGFAPVNHPKIAVAVVVPNAEAEGAFAAAPVGSKIVDDYFHRKDPNWLNMVEKKLDFLN